MAWQLLPVDYTDAIWSGLKRYNEVTNEDGTVSFQDVTNYSNKEKSFFGAQDANRMNEALNTIMSMLENGTDLYEAFQIYFNTQKELFEEEADNTQQDLSNYVDTLKTEGDAVIDELKGDYREEITNFEQQQEQLFQMWFDFIKGQLSEDAAGHLQNQIDDLDVKTDGFDSRSTAFSADGNLVTETYGDKKVETEFVSDSTIIQKLYVNNVLSLTKTVTFASDGLTIEEEVQ